MDNNEVKNISKEMPAELEKFRVMCETGSATEDAVLAILKKEIKMMLFKIVQNLYYIMKDHPINKARSMINGCMDNPETLRDYYNNMIVMDKSASKIKKQMTSMKDIKSIFGDSFQEYKKSAENFAGYLSGALNFTSSAVILIEQGEVKTNQAYLKMLIQNLNYMATSLEKSSKHIDAWENYGEGYVEMFDQIKVFFKDSADLIKKMIEEIRKNNEEKKVKSAEEQPKPTTPVRVVKVEQDEKTKNRLAAIKETNELYDRFQIDFMRDLQKEISMMNRDMYEELIDKIERFLKRFPMPLSDNVSLGMAMEAHSQINKFIEIFYEISRNTYTPVVFDK